MIETPGRFHSKATDHVVAGANEILDDVLQKKQSEINADNESFKEAQSELNEAQSDFNSEVREALGTGGNVDERIVNAVNTEKTRAEAAEEALDGRVDTLENAVGTGGSVDERIAEEGAKHYLKEETYNKTELNNMITTPNQEYVSVTATAQTTAVTDVLPATGAADTTYRVGNWDGTQYNDSVFSEYAWNGSAYIKLSTKSQVGEVYDISANHADTKYADLAAALGTNGANIPQSLRKGGMSVKFVQSSDNKYVQYRLTSDTFTTDVSYWQNVDTYKLTHFCPIHCVGNSIVWYNELETAVGHKYRISIENTETYSASGLTGYGFIVSKQKDTAPANLIVTYLPNKVGDLTTVEFTAPAESVFIGVKGQNGFTFKFSIEDITIVSDVEVSLDTKISQSINYQFEPLKTESGTCYPLNSGIIGSKTANESWDSILVNVKKGDVIHIQGTGGGGYRLWGVATSGKVLTRVANASVTDDLFLTINQNECLLCCNFNNSEPYSIKKKNSQDDWITLATSNSSQTDKDNADIVVSDAAEINNLLINGWKNIQLLEGTYPVTDTSISIKQTDTHIKGIGNVIISSNGTRACISAGASGIKDVYFENIAFTGYDGKEIYFKAYQTNGWHLKDCSINGWYFNSLNVSSNDAMTISIGGDNCDCNDFMDAYNFVTSAEYVQSFNVVLLIYGVNYVNDKTSPIEFRFPIRIEGKTKDAAIVFDSDNATGAFLFADGNDDRFPNTSIIKDVEFRQEGEYDGADLHCVDIASNYCKFYDCRFVNNTSSPVAYDSETDPTGTNINVHGDRRHGCLISGPTLEYDDKCKLELHGCTGIGSPYGFKNTRGFYIVAGSPKMYDCIGIGGGIGTKGYGIICHRSSKAILYNCIGYGSPYGYELCNGIQFQALSTSKLIGCIGYAGTGYQYISTGGKENYTKRTGSPRSGNSDGICCIMESAPYLQDCIGYAGNADYSKGIRIDADAHPIIKGGFYGKDRMEDFYIYKKDDDHDYMTLNIDNIHLELYLIGAYVDTQMSQSAGKKFIIKAGDTVIATADGSGARGEANMEIVNNIIPANSTVTLHVVDATTGDYVNAPEGVGHIRLVWYVNNIIDCCYIGSTANPQIDGCLFKGGNKKANGIRIQSEASNGYLVSNCKVDVDPDRYAVISNVARENVRVVNCLFTTSRIDWSITSFAQLTDITNSSNKYIL